MFIHNANSDNIACGLVIRTGFIHCITKNYVATGGMLINKAINGAVIKIHIKHCIFNYNGHFGKVIGIKDMKLTRRYKEIAHGAGLTVEIYKSVDFIASILIETPNSLIIMVVVVQEQVYILKTLQIMLL